MKIISNKEFLNMPNGTLFSKFNPCVFDTLSIKRDTIYNSDGLPIDYYYTNLIGNVASNSTDILFDSITNHSDFDLEFDTIERDGLYDSNALYAIYSDNERLQLIKTLSI